MANVLLLGPSFFGYRDMVAQEFSRLGHTVSVADDRPSESVLYKSIVRVSYRPVENTVNNYACQIVDMLSNGSFDYFIYLGGMSFCFTCEQISRMRDAAPQTHFIAALWDAFDNCPRFGSCYQLFDSVYSFEPRDCERYGLSLRPLFYSGVYAGLPLEPDDGFLWDACFIGSVHQQSKFHAVLETCNLLESYGLKVFKWFYMPSKSAAVLRSVMDSSYRCAEFQFKPLTPERVSDIYLHSRAVIDAPQAGQTGLTIRTLETLGARRKLITANTDVRNYDFYAYGNVALVNRSSEVDSSFYTIPYHELPTEIYESYSLSAFANTLLGQGSEYTGYNRRYEQ